MRFAVSSLTGIVVAGFALVTSAAAQLEGHWTGSAVKDGQKWRVHIEVTERTIRGRERTVALADFPDYGVYAVPLLA